VSSRFALRGLVICCVSAALVVGFAPARAESLRCDKALLQRGAHMYEVSQLCGAPVAEFSRIEYLQPNVAVYVDEWIYRFGNNKFERLLRFENNRLRRVRLLRKPVPQASFHPAPYSAPQPGDTGTVHRISW